MPWILLLKCWVNDMKNEQNHSDRGFCCSYYKVPENSPEDVGKVSMVSKQDKGAFCA